MNKKVLIFGPIGDFGGRDVEVNIIAKSLNGKYNISLLSSIYISDKSYALADLAVQNFTSFQIQAFNSSLLLRILAYVLKFKNKKNKKAYAFVKNKLSKKIFNFKKNNISILESKIKESDVVIACVQLSSNYLKELVEISNKHNKPCIVRTTGTIRDFDIKKTDFLKRVALFVHHSETNARNLNNQIELPYTIIDQCALNDNCLLELPINFNQKKKYGFLGRISREKGIIELIDFFCKNDDYEFIVAGNGVLKNDIEIKSKEKKNIKFLGQINQQELYKFFKEIDVLVIASHEESGPLVGLEAMAAGKIIISTKVGAMEDRLFSTENDFWIDINQKKSINLSIEIIEQLKQADLVKIAEINRQVYVKKYSFATIKSQYLALIDNIIVK